jgi:hypothetical protein
MNSDITQLSTPFGVFIGEPISTVDQGTYRTSTRMDEDFMFPPFNVTAILSDDSETLAIVALVNVAQPFTEQPFLIYQNCCLDNAGEVRLQFYICYTDLPVSTADFECFTLDFNASGTNLPKDVVLDDVKTIETFLWNRDPKTSRGTVTTVAKD